MLKTMDIGNILSQLRQEHEQVTEIIMSLERLAITGTKRRGRPPKWLSEAKASSGAPRRGRPPGSKNKVGIE
jgi:hypothetical protein